MEQKKIHEAQKSLELPHCALIDTPDKLLEYTLEIITTKSDVDLRRIRLKEVHTLAEAIFAPQRKPVEITYLIYDPNPPCKFSNIYWLVPAPVDTLNLKSHYFTMTSFGLTNVTNADNGMITARPTSSLTCIYLEMYDLSTWLSEKAIFDKIARMPSIQLMRKMNVFYTWKRNTIGMRFVRARKAYLVPPITGSVRLFYSTSRHEREKAISPIVDPTRSLFFSDLIPRDRNQLTRDLQEVVSRIEDILLEALTPLVGEHSRYSDHATSSDFVPVFVRVVDFMVIEALFEALCSSISHLSCSISGLPTDQQLLKSSFCCRSDDDYTKDLYAQIDALLARPFEHSGNITYKRLFQLQGAVRPPDPLFILKIAIHNTHITIIPEKELWLRKFRDMIADYISALDRVERISANSKIQDFVHKYCRPYFRHFFAEGIHSFSTIVNNHLSIETMMKDLRTTLDIYFAEIEHLTSSCLPLKAEFLQIEKKTPPLSQGTLESVTDVTRIVQTHITLRRELQAADMMLLVGCFLVDRSIFVGEMLAKCNNKLLELYQELPKFCNHFFKRVVDDLAKRTSILVSIPESVEECTEWLACFCGLQSHTRSPVIHMGPCVSSLQQMVDSCRNDCPPELSSNLVNSFESGHLQWKIQNKALREILSRIEDNRSFYQELLSRTLSSRREILTTELCTASSKLNEAIKAVNIFGSDQGGFGGPEVQNLVKIARGLLDRNDLLTRLTSFLDQFVHLNSSKTKDAHRRRYSSFRSGSVSHLFKVYDHVSAVLALVDIAHSFVQFRQSFERVPLIDLDLSNLLSRVVSLKRLSQPHCATLDGMHHPLVSQFYPSAERLQEALEIAIPMTQSQFTPERWKIVENILSLTQDDKCCISHIEAGLSRSTTKELLGKLSAAANQEAHIQSTLNQVKSQISSLSLDFTANDHSMRVTNCLEITSSLADCRMTLLRIRHHENPWLVEVHRLESQISNATDLINLIHEMDSAWNEIAVVLAMPELKAYEKDPELWADVELIGRTWQDCLVAGCYWNDQASSHIFIKLETIFKSLDLPHYIRQCERMRASIWSYFQTLRIAFPRLYMISNHEMLAMFNEPNRVQVVIKRCYLGIKLVECSDIKNIPESKTHIAGMMDSDFMTWLLGDHSVSFIHSVQFAGCSWTLPLFRPVKILGPLAFWLGQFDTLLNHSLTAKAITAMSQFAYDPKSSSPIDQIKEWTTKLPPQLILNFLHVHFCTLVERLIVSAPGTTSGRTLLQSSVANQRDYIQRLVSHVRTSNGQNTVIEDAILLLNCQQDTLYQLAAHAETYDWSNVMLTWEHTFRLVANSKSDELSIEARIGQVSVPCGLELQPTMPWIVILPTTQRCIFALFHVMRLNVSIMPTGEARMGKKTLLRSLSYLLMRPQWELICHHNTSVSVIESFTKGIESLHGWGHVLCASNLTAAVLGGFVCRMRELQASLSSSAQVSENFRCIFFLMNQGINVHSSLARWVGQPLRPLAILPPDQFLLLKALFSAKGFSVDKNIKLVDCVLRTLYAASTSVVSQCRFRLLPKVVNTAYKITKEVNYVIHSHGKHGSHVKHDASPLNVTRYKDTNVFRFALLLVLEPLGLVSSSQLHTVLDQFIPSNLTLTQENRTFASAFKVVLDRGHFAQEAKFIESGVALHHMLKVSPRELWYYYYCRRTDHFG
ncbi:Dynein heavy chain 3, axonemal [Aphanomyces cochlioides]|nr:Dynein heavy chain 3, axonemal [Aphanomyces cochlioides]